MSRYYPKGIPKVAYVRWSHIRPPVRFAERTFGGPHLYVYAKDRGICLADLAHVRLLRVNILLLFSKGDQVISKGFKYHLSGFIKSSC